MKSDAVNQAFESASDLVEAAETVSRAIDEPQARDAHPSVLGCIEVALRDLERAARNLKRSMPPTSDVQALRAQHGLENLAVALHDAAMAAGAARALAARALVGRQAARSSGSRR